MEPRSLTLHPSIIVPRPCSSCLRNLPLFCPSANSDARSRRGRRGLRDVRIAQRLSLAQFASKRIPTSTTNEGGRLRGNVLSIILVAPPTQIQRFDMFERCNMPTRASDERSAQWIAPARYPRHDSGRAPPTSPVSQGWSPRGCIQRPPSTLYTTRGAFVLFRSVHVRRVGVCGVLEEPSAGGIKGRIEIRP